MDIIVSYFAMPFGILLCFGPALVVWVLAEMKSPKSDSGDAKGTSAK